MYDNVFISILTPFHNSTAFHQVTYFPVCTNMFNWCLIFCASTVIMKIVYCVLCYMIGK